MESLSSCPACNTSLSLFTPRQISRHINACLDASPTDSLCRDQLRRCPVCDRDLTRLTLAARAEHENRCVDSLNPNRQRNAPSAHTTRTPRTPRSPRQQPVPQDDRVYRFLELLGLERYVQRFTEQEIDFPALRLLKDSDFAHLRIPDAARRRIAHALTAVPVLAQIEGTDVHSLTSDPAPLPTQNFGTSKLGRQMRRSKALLELDDSDGEYIPTPLPQHSPSEANGLHDQGPCERIIDKAREDRSNQNDLRTDDDDYDDFHEIERMVKSKNAVTASESSDVSSLPSDPENLNDLLSSTSQITLELKLRKWRRKHIENENNRHRRELQRIEEEYTKLATSKNVLSSEDKQTRHAPDPPKVIEHDCDTIDLTQDILAEEGEQSAVLKISTTKNLEESIVISSNETVPKATTTVLSDEQQQKKDGESCIKKQKGHAQVVENITKAPSEPRSPCSETRTPTQNKPKQVYDDEEVMNLISTEKKRRPKPGSSSTLSLTRGNDEHVSVPITRPEGTGRGVTSESDEDFMDLLGVGKENTRSSTRPTSSATDAPKRSCTENELSATEEAPTQTRLKKRPKKLKRVMATAADIAQLIRKDKTLYEDILMMESVPFDRILTRLRGGEKHVTKKALYNFLQDEGILFKGDSIEPGSQQESYMRLLNSDGCPD